ncbi:MAG: diguanylate cyclase [Pseudomonadota bacterium]|nr:diguanylate cyclase [Pseudomonadota bacterium]
MRRAGRVDRGLGVTVLSVACLGVLIGLAALCGWQARVLQLRLDHHYVAGAVSAALAPAMRASRGRIQLGSAVEALMQRRDLALKAIWVRDVDDVVLASAGRLEAWRVPLLPREWQDRARDVLYGVIGSRGQHRVFSADRRVLGTLEYVIDLGDVEGIRVQAVTALRFAGWIAGGLALPVLLMLVISIRRELRKQPQWTQRAQPSAGNLGLDFGSADRVEFRNRAANTMDVLKYGIVVADRGGCIRLLNQTAAHLTGWSAEDASGRLLRSVIHIVDADGMPQNSALDTLNESSRPEPTQATYLRQRSGGVLPVELTVNLYRGREGAIDTITLLFRDTSIYQRELQQTQRQARLAQAVVDHLDEGLLTTDMAGVVRSANARAERMFGYSRDELNGFTVSKLMPVPFLNVPAVRIVDFVGGATSAALPKVVGWRKDATTFPVELQVQTMRAEGAQLLVVIIRDISERLRGENLANRLGRLLDGAKEEVYIFDAQTLRFLEVNRGATDNLGYRADLLARMGPLDISEELDKETLDNYLSSLRGGEREHLVYRCRHRRADESSYPVEVRLNYSPDEEPPVFMAIATDITDRLAAEIKLNQMALFDALTGLPNRVMLFERMHVTVADARRAGRMLGVFFVDLDRFKLVNDQYGHDVGDQVLRIAADRLRSVVRPIDTVARLSGDEFVVLVSDLETPARAEQIAQQILERFAQPMDLGGPSITVTPSIGYTLSPLDDSDVDGLLRHADTAMYLAKQRGRGCYEAFSSGDDSLGQRELRLEREIHAAVALNQFQLTVTPAVDANGSTPVVLGNVSWDHPQYGTVDQQQIMQAASRAGLRADVELWLLCRACEQLCAAAERGEQPPEIIIPISGWQFRDHEFARHLADLLQRYRVPVNSLVLSLSPDGLVEFHDRHGGVQDLLDRGLRFALRGFNAWPASVPEAATLAYVVLEAAQWNKPDVLASIRTAAPDHAVFIAADVNDAAQLKACRKAGIELMTGSVFEQPTPGSQT